MSEFSKPLEQNNPERKIPDRSIDRFKDPNYLPGYYEFLRIFSEYLRKKLKIPRGELNTPRKDYDPANSKGPLWELTFETGDHQILTREYIHALSDYLSSRISELTSELKRPVKIVETGAGTGRLAHFITEDFKERKPEELQLFTYQPTDIYEGDNPFPVDIVDYKEAIKGADIVVTSWMPIGHDWSKDYRAEASVQEYILLGNPIQGNVDTFIDSQTGSMDEIGGFGKVELEDVAKWSIQVDNDLYPYEEYVPDGKRAKQSMFKKNDEENLGTAVSWRRINET